MISTQCCYRLICQTMLMDPTIKIRGSVPLSTKLLVQPFCDIIAGNSITVRLFISAFIHRCPLLTKKLIRCFLLGNIHVDIICYHCFFYAKLQNSSYVIFSWKQQNVSSQNASWDAGRGIWSCWIVQVHGPAGSQFFKKLKGMYPEGSNMIYKPVPRSLHLTSTSLSIQIMALWC